ncbi:PREDICTED: hyaluronan and proteoglycan link protein 1-like [Cyprinodon variegatus]|uniref:hyaluronan and proteoglycan link protein 1-like n=1 Tax=Cyprinodon variegatus TaxID=28743 RepID=UPI000742A29E|nr:PREDICTED: hyaluronan and proteoglycan link protein 1-like [Cyprinodon variegatus]XP_015239524.1 PREDICTED: hyaluronan and proteoglycan link protein 1-like [Cyprinodon variegatus]XP_015239525.1 PREDICTED: hyaluronan and proteoglycan link protein 1-like [Cyprinodon variegatus]
MIPLMICALVSMSVADTSLDREVSNLEYSRTIYVIENGPKLNVTSGQSKVISRRGGTVTLPCRIQRDPQLTSISTMRIKWTKDTADFLKEVKVFVAAGHRNKSYGTFQGRVHLQRSSPMDASLVMKDLTLDDYGTYRCEVMDGLEDDTAVVSLELEGVVFPYFPRLGRYNLNFNDAARACRDQDAVVASFKQLYDAWQEGMDWCNAGWLSDGTVQYPITNPREPCGGKNTPPGVRNYGLRDKGKTHYDVFCFTSFYRGKGQPFPFRRFLERLFLFNRSLLVNPNP